MSSGSPAGAVGLELALSEPPEPPGAGDGWEPSEPPEPPEPPEPDPAGWSAAGVSVDAAAGVAGFLGRCCCLKGLRTAPGRSSPAGPSSTLTAALDTLPASAWRLAAGSVGSAVEVRPR